MRCEHEPTLEELLNDTLVRQVMATDGYSPDDIRNLFKNAESSEGPRRPATSISARARPCCCSPL